MIIRVIVTNTINASIENLFNPSEIIANQKDNPAVTVSVKIFVYYILIRKLISFRSDI